MASRISQIRSGQMQMPQQQQLNQSIEQVRGLMSQMRTTPNREQLLMNILQANPQFAQIASMAARGGNLQGVAEQMANTYGIDLNNLITQLVK